MAFGINHSQATSNILPEGTYEVIIKSASLEYTKNGTEHILVLMIVRNDIEQKYKNARIWHRMWRKKEPDTADLACDGFSNAQIQTLSKAANLTNGLNFNSLEDWFYALKSKPLEVSVKHQEYNGYKNLNVAAINPTKYTHCLHTWAAADPSNPANVQFEELPADDLDLPFDV